MKRQCPPTYLNACLSIHNFDFFLSFFDVIYESLTIALNLHDLNTLHVFFSSLTNSPPPKAALFDIGLQHASVEQLQQVSILCARAS